MDPITTQLERIFRRAIHDALGIEADPAIAPSQNEKFGDYQSNAAMGLAKIAKSNPRAVAEQIKAKLDLGDMATSADVSIAGPGFINVRLSPEWLATQIQSILKDDRLTVPLAVSQKKIVVDYSGPNIAKEMHVGHLRSTIIGDAIANVFEKLGHSVIRQNHIGDWGTQFGMLIQRKLETNSTIGQISDLEAEYRAAKIRFDEDPKFADESRKRVVELQDGSEQIRGIWSIIVDETRQYYQPVYDRLGVKLKQSDERGESFYNSILPKIVLELKEKNIAVESQGATVVFVDGPEKPPLIIEKTGGGYLYSTTDLAAVWYRIHELHADRIVYTHDSRQANHFRQVFDTARKASWTQGDKIQLDYAPFGTMLGEDGKPFKSRMGDLIKLKELLDEAESRALKLITEKNPDLPETHRQDIARAVGIGAVKYADLSKDRISDYIFSFDKMLALDGNTAPYLQYAYARIKSIFRKSAGLVASATTVTLDTPFEQSLAKHILRFGEIVELVSRELKPHHLCTYLYELATRFSSFYENCPVLQSEEALRSSRLALCNATARTLALGLDLLGIEHPEQM